MTRPTVLLSGVEFGWGSAGKLSAICSELLDADPTIRLVGLGSLLGRPVLRHMPVERWYDAAGPAAATVDRVFDEESVDAALIVLDPELAASLAARSCPTVYVDSLPFLWGVEDAVPGDVAVYCAQRYVGLGAEPPASLRSVRNLRWVGGIVESTGTPVPRTGPVVVNVGGLHSPFVGSADAGYLTLVLPTALAALSAVAATEVVVCGNLPPDAEGLLSGLPSSPVQMRPGLPHREFLDLLQKAPVCLTSPGLTTLLELSAAGTPTVVLPPQNISQVLNAEQFASLVDPALRVRWPAGLVDLEAVFDAAARTEETGLKLFYGAVAAAATIADRWRATIEEDVVEALRCAACASDWSRLARAVGTEGARDVAVAVTEQLETRP
ncbi:MAG: hydroxymethylcytosylglucuronate/cytosylglucuronate synthase [Egibacteraceae bacterium]